MSTAPGELCSDELTEDAGDLAGAGPPGHRSDHCRILGHGDDVVGPLGAQLPGQVVDEGRQGVAHGQAGQQRQPCQVLSGNEGPQDHGDQEGSLVGSDPGAPGPPSTGGLPQRPKSRQVRPGSGLGAREDAAQVVLGGAGHGDGVKTREGAAA